MHSQTLRVRKLIADTWRAGVVPVVVWGNPAAFRFLYLDEDPDFETLERERKQGLRYCGVVGVINGKPKAVCGPDSDVRDIEAMRHAGIEFARQYRAQQAGDELEWINSLYALNDLRSEGHDA